MILAFIAFAWLLGIATAAYTGSDPAAAVAAAGLLSTAIFALRPRPATLLALAVGASAVFLATWRYADSAPTIPPDAIQAMNDSDEVRFRAIVDDEPQQRTTSTAYRLAVKKRWESGVWRHASGAVLMTAAGHTELEYGDLVEISGELTKPPILDGFDYREYLARQGIGSLIAYPEIEIIASDQGSSLKSSLISIRADLEQSLESALPQPEASLSAGILLGSRQSLPRDLRNDMDATGTSHLVAVSGQNITILAASVIAALAWLLGRRIACWAALLAVLAYAVFVGAEPSVIRAAIMGAIFIFSIAVGRQNSGWVALFVAAAGMTALDPQIAHDVSFQLSLAAVLGLVVLATPLRERIEIILDRSPALRHFPLSRPATDLLVMSLASIALTLPITAVNFHQVSIVAPLTNLFTVPAFVLVAATSGLVALAGLISPGAADALAWLAWPPAAYMVSTIQAFASLPAASIRLDGVATLHAVAYYAILAVATFWLRRPLVRLPELPTPPLPARRGLSVAGLILVLALSSLLVWLAASPAQSGRLSVTVLDVGQGDAILVETPSGNRVLVDGGPGEAVLQAALGRHLPFYDRRIDLVTLTHPQADHAGGLPAVLEQYGVGAVLGSSTEPQSAAGDHWREVLAASRTPVIEATRGMAFDVGDGAILTVISPPTLSPHQSANLNDASIVLRLTYGSFSMLLTGDIGSEAEYGMERLGAGLQSTVLKVAHHGSRTSTSADFLSLVDSSVAVISVGKDNRFGHPAPEVLERLEDQAVYRTDQSGDVTVSTDGHKVWVSTQNN